MQPSRTLRLSRHYGVLPIPPADGADRINLARLGIHKTLLVEHGPTVLAAKHHRLRFHDEWRMKI